MAIVRTDLVPWGELNALLRRLNIGLLLFLALAAWGLLSHPTAPGGPAFAAALLVGALGWAAGVLVARVDPTLPGIAVAGLAVLVLGLGLPGSVSGDAAPGPMGYANANAALLTAAVAGLLGAALRLRTRATAPVPGFCRDPHAARLCDGIARERRVLRGAPRRGGCCCRADVTGSGRRPVVP